MPEIVERDEQPYVAVKATVRMTEIGAFAERGDEVFDWLAQRGVEPAGAVFFKYDVVDMEAGLVIELGVPVAEAQQADGEIVAGVLPAGRYARVTHHGHPDGLLQVTGDLLAWAEQEGLQWDADGNNWGCRLEVYHSDPDEVPDLNDWDTELLFRLKD
ncbi:transcriptional activator ligand binding domain protein [Kribbella flavida DSM 17836]|uniref:Transcriptional activator ligand binding domain protein n=1 Tax=Kribbella flavida (strain DSM 17836 / JCM 10339 / NBRC 14399) TaxID=479435 RepID=D2Q3I3_KRIFD|nr:GyrI-like domain-containing protein [Kribbella flavida]ADB34106.1 transcriptional activator ligand binding domain protein [Kribbella flavida DSM 17836]